MTANLMEPGWEELDPAELRCVLLEVIGGPGQYDGRESSPNIFYLPLARDECQIKVTFANDKRIARIEPGASFDRLTWQRVVDELTAPGPYKIGREFSFSSFRVEGSWRGPTSGVQILPAPPDAPRPHFEYAEHPFVLESPLRVSTKWPITRFRWRRENRYLTQVLNVLLNGRTTFQPRQLRHFWAIATDEEVSSQKVKWMQEFYFANLGEVIQDQLSPSASQSIEQIDPDTYYATIGHDGGSLRVPTDLDESICCYRRLSKSDRQSFMRATFWMDMASRQWTLSFSASFASVVFAIEALGRRDLRPTERFRTFIEQYSPDASLADRRLQMYALRNDIVHGTGLMEMDDDAHFGWSPPEQVEEDLMWELRALARVALRNWLKTAGRS